MIFHTIGLGICKINLRPLFKTCLLPKKWKNLSSILVGNYPGVAILFSNLHMTKFINTKTNSGPMIPAERWALVWIPCNCSLRIFTISMDCSTCLCTRYDIKPINEWNAYIVSRKAEGHFVQYNGITLHWHLRGLV